ncbi:polysaccharide deacetylase family protein [Pseudorhodoferax sp.]|uniref:polysaccharide deacetylase family protein n=1 Tax=Pseudorhodoferax sp. TaxID=1993553 RepID=UPI002DD67686|nr:polysaccharide deacetylase family protein [Pseudorhodoferax sp.]
MMLGLATRWLSSNGGDARLTVLIFHRVHGQLDPLFPGEPDRERFDQILGWLRRWYRVLPLADAIRLLRDGALPPGTAAITFDDGYADNATHALPILQRHGLTATFFITTDFLNGGRMWNDSVVEAVRGCRHEALDLREYGLGQYALSDLVSRQQAIGELLKRIKYLEPTERQHAVANVVQASDAHMPDDLMLTTEQLHALRCAGMGIGAHTCTHPILARLGDATALHEIAEGRSRLEQLLQQRVGLFAYPNGKPDRDYKRVHVEQVRSLGFDAAVSTAPGAANRDTDTFQLPRFTPWDRTAWRYGARLLRNLRTPIVEASTATAS